MNILITTHQLANFAGSELYTFQLAKGLSEAGHRVTVYSRYVDVFESLFALEKIHLVMDLNEVKKKHFDVAHVQHNITALEVRQLFPEVPIFFLSHSGVAFLEHVPLIDVNISLYGAVSEYVKASLKKQGVLKRNVVVVNNLIDEKLFSSVQSINDVPKQAVIISNRIDSQTESRIEKACKKLGIKLKKVGARFESVPNEELPQIINDADIVFSLGRGVMETMMCGRVPFILDFKGGDGMVTPQTYSHLESCHFNGTLRGQKFTVAQIVKEIREKYSVANGKDLQRRTVRRYGTSYGVHRLVKLYKKTIALNQPKEIDQQLINYIVTTVHVTRLHTFSRSEAKGLREYFSDVRAGWKHSLKTFRKKTKGQVSGVVTRGVVRFRSV